MEHFQYCKIEIFIPETYFAVLLDALRSVDAGHIGHYDSCLSLQPGNRLLAASGRKQPLYRQRKCLQFGARAEGGGHLPARQR